MSSFMSKLIKPAFVFDCMKKNLQPTIVHNMIDTLNTDPATLGMVAEILKLVLVDNVSSVCDLIRLIPEEDKVLIRMSLQVILANSAPDPDPAPAPPLVPDLAPAPAHAALNLPPIPLREENYPQPAACCLPASAPAPAHASAAWTCPPIPFLRANYPQPAACCLPASALDHAALNLPTIPHRVSCLRRLKIIMGLVDKPAHAENVVYIPM